MNDDIMMLLGQRIDYKKPVFVDDFITTNKNGFAISISVGVVEINLPFKK